MLFNVIEASEPLPTSGLSQAYLRIDNWDDRFKYSTQFYLIIFDADGLGHPIGALKIGRFGMGETRRPNIPTEFGGLGDSFFSVGQDVSYYERLNGLRAAVRIEVLVGLRDFAADLQLFDRALEEQVTKISLLRDVSESTVRGQFHRMALGGPKVAKYEFAYIVPSGSDALSPQPVLQFDVVPFSNPPTNIHVLIGRNGVGKTRLLNLMARALSDDRASAFEVGTFQHDSPDLSDVQFQTPRSKSRKFFANLVLVSFSAFDPFVRMPEFKDSAEQVRYSYVGLKKLSSGNNELEPPHLTPERLKDAFVTSVQNCLGQGKQDRWRSALEMLEADPIFEEANVSAIVDVRLENQVIYATSVFNTLSSGHKIVLLTITRLVESVNERTLVLFDEPEAHLHPPLLSALIRALSSLLVEQNGVAIIATHSPVVLQEVPRSCVWKLRRAGSFTEAERPEIETFGENVGSLTRDVFGLEVTQTGFHRLLSEAVNDGYDYESVLERFGNQLGAEARGIVRGLIAATDAETQL